MLFGKKHTYSEYTPFTPSESADVCGETQPRRCLRLGSAPLLVAVFFRMRFGRLGGMVRGMFMMPTGGMRMMRRFLVIPSFMMFGGFFVMSRGVLMLFRRVIVMLGCFGGHRETSLERVLPK